MSINPGFVRELDKMLFFRILSAMLMPNRRFFSWFSFVLLSALLSVVVGGCNDDVDSGPDALDELVFLEPAFGQLSPTSGVEVVLEVGPDLDVGTLGVELDGDLLDPSLFTFEPAGEGAPPGTQLAMAVLNDLEVGPHELEAVAFTGVDPGAMESLTLTDFVAVNLENPDECEVLSPAHCLLPFPSSAFQEDVGAETETGVRLRLPEFSLTGVAGDPISPDPVNRFDGFAPTVQIVTYLENVDVALSGASRLLPEGPAQSPPYVDSRTHDDTSLMADSPTIVMDADTGERVLHWVEVDGTTEALADRSRQVLFVRPALSLEPGHRYIVALREMVNDAGEVIPADPVFATLRDGLPTTIPGVEARRADLEEVFDRLESQGIERSNLQMAVQFQVRSQQQLQEGMLFMRDDALAWLEALEADDVSGFTDVEIIDDFGDCSSEDQEMWRAVRGSFNGPFYMTADIDVGDLTNPPPVSVLNVDENDMPVRNGTAPFAWDIAVPCSVYRGERTGYPLLLGHGFLGRGRDMVGGFAAGSFFPSDGPVSYIAGGTDWRGLSRGFNGPDVGNIVHNVIGVFEHRFNTFRTLPDRLTQGMVNTLVLSRMMKNGFFNRLEQFQRTPGDPATGVFTAEAEMFYFGVSLGGIYGTMYAALNADTIRHNVDVPAMNFSVMQQRATPFIEFLALIKAIGLVDPMELAVIIGLQHEIWVSAEPAPYMRNITGTVDPTLPGSPPKHMLVTVAYLDKQVSNQATNIFSRTMGIPNLVGSIQAQMPGLPDVNADINSGNPGLESAMHIYDSGFFDIFDEAYQPYLPPLTNVIPTSTCDPHGTARLSIPASIDQLQTFLQPGGLIFNYCDGICDARDVYEQPSYSCNPLGD